jgi:hypothetical protein
MPQDRLDRLKLGGHNMRNTRPTRFTKLTRFVLGAAAAALVVGASYSPARAADDDIASQESFTDKFLRTIGVKDPTTTEYEINYSERSPLVVPPSRNLPPPVKAATVPAPDWPKDPDLKKKKADKDDKPVIRPFDSVMETSRPLRPDELGVGRPAPTVSTPGTPEQSTPSQLGEQKKSFFSFDWMKKEQYGTFTGEPRRASLTDPPPGYQTPSPDQPYGITPEHKDYTPKSLGERLEPVR